MLGNLVHVHSKLNSAADWQANEHMLACAPHEREARFRSVICEQELRGQARQAMATLLGFTLTPDSKIFEVSAGSTEAKIEVGGFMSAISGEQQVGLLSTSIFGKVRGTPAENSIWWQNKPRYSTMLAQAFRVTIVSFDRERRGIAVELKYPDAVDELSAARIVDLSGRCIIDPTKTDFLSKKIESAVRAIKNPPKASLDDAQARAMTPRHGR